MQQLVTYWQDMNGNDFIDEFESKWTQWNIHDSIKWFEYVLLTKYNQNEVNTLSDSDSDSGDEHNNDNDEKKDGGNMMMSTNNHLTEKDYKLIEAQLISIGFRAKQNLSMIQKSFQFKQYGFKDKYHRKILCKYTKMLIAKYPKQSGKGRQSGNDYQK